MRSVLHKFAHDNRAIEGLPVRLVIALVVGVASLGVMMNMLSGIEGLAVSELDVRPEPELTTPGHQSIGVMVVDSDGSSVSDATVVLSSGTAAIDGTSAKKSDETGSATFTVAPELRSNQDDGTLEVEIKPPPGSDYVDRRGNTEILVVAD